jgi:hypothetical protein
MASAFPDWPIRSREPEPGRVAQDPNQFEPHRFGRRTPFRWQTPGVGRHHRLLCTAEGWSAAIAINATAEPAAFDVDGDRVEIYGCGSDEAETERVIPLRSGRLIVLSGRS